MKVLSLSLYTFPTEGTASLFSTASDLSDYSFLTKGSVQEGLNFLASTVASRTGDGQRQSVQEGSNAASVYRKGGVAAVLITTTDYPVRVSFSVLNKVLDEYTSESWSKAVGDAKLAEYVRKYQDPKQADTIMKVQQELDETKIVLHKTIESVLERGEKLDNLVERSNALSAQSKMFYKTAKKTRRRMFPKAVSASLARKGKFGILWLAATVGSHERSLPRTELIKINLSEACEQIVAAEPAGAPPTPSPSSSDLSSDEDEDEGARGKRKAKTKKKTKKGKRRKADAEGERVVVGLRLSANLMLGVCRVYDFQVTVTSSDATQLFLGLRPMLNEYNRGGKAGVAGGPRRLDMDDAAARPNNSNLDAPEDPDLMFGYAHGFGNPEWDNLEFEVFSSVKLTTQSGSTMTGEDDDLDDDETQQGRARQRSTIGSPSRINLHEPHLYGPDYRGSQAPELAPEFDPGVALGLGLLADDEMLMDEPGAPSAFGGRPSSSAFAPGGTGLGDDFQYPQDNDLNFGDFQPMDVDQPGQPRIPSSEDVTESSLSSILKAPGAIGPKKKKTVKLAKMDAELTFPDSEIKDWRKTYVRKQIALGKAAKEKHAEKDAKDAAVAVLQQVPAVIGIQAPDMVNFLLGRQNMKRSFLRSPKPRRRPKKRAGSEELSEEIEEFDDDQRPAAFYPGDNDNFDMGDVQPMDDDGQERYIDYSILLKGDETTFVRRSDEDDGSEMGRRQGSSRKSSSAPWDSVQRRTARDSSVGFGDVRGPGSSSIGRASTQGGRQSFAADSVHAGGRHRRAGSHISSGGRSGSVDRFGRPSRAGDDLEAAYPEADMLQDEAYLLSDDEVVSTFSLERHSVTFLEYLKRMLFDLPRPTPVLDDEGENIAEPTKTILFSQLAPIDSCTPSAAAKGFYHCLVLCTKDVVGLAQEDFLGDIEVTLK